MLWAFTSRDPEVKARRRRIVHLARRIALRLTAVWHRSLVNRIEAKIAALESRSR
jgi:hypothetical protein